MDAADAETTRVKLRHLLAGLEAGMLGAIYMIVWLMLGSRLARRSIWDIPNLFATTFYGPMAYEGQYFRSSWSGVALIVAICGLGGMLWGLVWRDDRQPFLTLFGGIGGLAVYFLFFDFVWKWVNPEIPMYAPLRQLQIGGSLTFEEAMRTEFRIVSRVCRGHDFYEGVRAVIVDKDMKPQWRPAPGEPIPAADIDAYFAPLAPAEELKLGEPA